MVGRVVRVWKGYGTAEASRMLTRFDEHVPQYTLALAHQPPPRAEDV